VFNLVNESRKYRVWRRWRYCEIAEYHSANAVSTIHLTLSIGACYAQEENQGKSESPKIVTEPLLCVESCDLLVEC